MAGDDDKMFMTRSLNVTPKTTEHHLIVYNYISPFYAVINLSMAGDDDKMFMTRSLNVTPKTTEHHLIVYNYISPFYAVINL